MSYLKSLKRRGLWGDLRQLRCFSFSLNNKAWSCDATTWITSALKAFNASFRACLHFKVLRKDENLILTDSVVCDFFLQQWIQTVCPAGQWARFLLRLSLLCCNRVRVVAVTAEVTGDNETFFYVLQQTSWITMHTVRSCVNPEGTETSLRVILLFQLWKRSWMNEWILLVVVVTLMLQVVGLDK